MNDLSRTKSQEPDESWPELVEIALHWKAPNGHTVIKTETISADQFFGRNGYGAPMSGEHVVAAIERLRRAGPPKAPKRPSRKPSR